MPQHNKMSISTDADRRISPSQVAANNENAERARLMPGEDPKHRIILSLLKWAGREKNGCYRIHLLPRLGAELNTRLGDPFEAEELEEIIGETLEKIESFDYSEEGLSAWRSERGRRGGTQSGVVRRAKSAEQDKLILKARESGMTQKAVAARFGVSQSWISQLEKREREEEASMARSRQADEYNPLENDQLEDFDFAQFYDRRPRRTKVTPEELLRICEEEERLEEAR